MITLGILAIAPFARIVRAQTLSLRERDFVLAARSLGAKSRRVIWREIMPNLVPAMVTVAVTGLGILIAAEGALAFLGLGVDPTADLGHDDRRRTRRPRRRRGGRRSSRASSCSSRCSASTSSVTAWRASSTSGRPPYEHRHPGLDQGDRRAAPRTRRRAHRTSRRHAASCAPSTVCRFTLERGKALGIVGESGSGKTILSRSIMGLLPTRGTDPSGQRPVRGPRDRRTVAQGDARRVGQGNGDDLPGSDDLAEPADEDRRADRRAAATPPRHVEGRRLGNRRAAAAGRAHPRARPPAAISTRTRCRAACASAS